MLSPDLSPNAKKDLSRRQPKNQTRTSLQASADNFPEMSRQLKEFYRPWNEKLAELLGDEKWLDWNVKDESEMA